MTMFCLICPCTALALFVAITGIDALLALNMAHSIPKHHLITRSISCNPLRLNPTQTPSVCDTCTQSHLSTLLRDSITFTRNILYVSRTALLITARCVQLFK